MTTASIRRRFSFSAAHRLHCPTLSDQENKALFGKCNHEHGHGHNYEVTVELKGEIDPITGMVWNLSDLKGIFKKAVEDDFDHRNLNKDIQEFKHLNPTIENVCLVIWKRLRPHFPQSHQLSIEAFETENNSSRYTG